MRHAGVSCCLSGPPRHSAVVRGLPNLITALRMVLAPVMVVLAHATADAGLVLGLMVFGMALFAVLLALLTSVGGAA